MVQRIGDVVSTPFASKTPLEALQQQLACYQRLLKLSDLQRTHVRHNRTDDLLKVLEARSHILTEIGELEATVSPLKRDWAVHSFTMKPDVRERAAAMLAEAKGLLLQITQADMDDVLVLQQRKLTVGKQITQNSTAKRVNTRYAGNAYASAAGSKLNVKQ